MLKKQLGQGSSNRISMHRWLYNYKYGPYYSIPHNSTGFQRFSRVVRTRVRFLWHGESHFEVLYSPPSEESTFLHMMIYIRLAFRNSLPGTNKIQRADGILRTHAYAHVGHGLSRGGIGRIMAQAQDRINHSADSHGI